MSRKTRLYSKSAKLSLKNAEQWMKDAKLLIENSSFGHASALLRFACEEIAKAQVCWLTSEQIIPKNNKIIRDVFRYHETKNNIILAMAFTILHQADDQLSQKIDAGRLKLSEEKIDEAFKIFEDMVISTEKMRQKAMYVNLDTKKSSVETPLMIEEKEVKTILWLPETLLKIVRYNLEESSETEKETLRKMFTSIPNDAWETGEISIEQLHPDK